MQTALGALVRALGLAMPDGDGPPSTSNFAGTAIVTVEHTSATGKYQRHH
jgi:hypothetical protein